MGLESIFQNTNKQQVFGHIQFYAHRIGYANKKQCSITYKTSNWHKY